MSVDQNAGSFEEPCDQLVHQQSRVQKKKQL